MYTKFLIILLLIFIVFNSQKLKEKFSNAFQDTEIRAKLSLFETNLSEEKPLLTLYYDRREPNCKYFYDYFSKHYGGRKKLIDLDSMIRPGLTLNQLIDTKNGYEEELDDPSITDERRDLVQRIILSYNRTIQEGNYITDEEVAMKEVERIRQAPDEMYQKSKKFTGKSQAWNQFKAIYAKTDENKYIKPNFLKIEEIEVKDGKLYDFNDKPAYKIEDNGYIEYLGTDDNEKPREYKQYYKPDNFLDRIPKLVLSFFKHKSKEDIETIMEDLGETNYANLKHFQKYDYYVIEYDGLYSPNNRQIKTTLDNIIKFINETYDKYLLCPSQESHNLRIGETIEGFTPHTFTNKKCNVCSEYFT
jgi:hypothetical protein